VAAILPAGGVPEDAAVNQVLVASDLPIREPRPEPEDGTFLDESDTRDYLAGANVLTDDHAPVDQLLLR
jgi:hypothetical protein